MKSKTAKQQIRHTNETQIIPLIKSDDFLRLNMYNYIRSEFRNEAKKLQPLGTGKMDFTNVYNISTAWDYVLQNLHTQINIHEIRKINSIIFNNSNENIQGGMFRTSMAFALGTLAPNYVKIYSLLDDAVHRLNSDNNQILNKAFNIHYDIITIQPFPDFNKRTARVIMNWYLLQNNYTPILFNHRNDDTEYFANIKARLNGDTKTYTAYMCDRMKKTQHTILRTLLKKSK